MGTSSDGYDHLCGQGPMIENILKLSTYMVSLVMVMIGLSSLPFEKVIRKNKVAQFYLLYTALTMGLTYLVANFLLDVFAIRFG